MLKTSARLPQLRLLSILWSFILALWTASELFLAYGFISFGADRLTWGIYVLTLVVLGSCIVFLLARTLLRLRASKRFEQQRQDAAQGQQALLATEQPIPDASALELPSTIIHRPAWFPVALRIGILLLAMIFFGTMWFSSVSASSATSAPESPVIEYGPFLILAIFIISYCIYLFWISYAREYRHILITEDGLSVSGFLTRARFIAWKDIRLLALVALFPNRLQPHFQIEVSSSKEVVYWPWPHQTISNNPYFRDPSEAAREYEQQVYKALAVITARTGLPFYDLRHR